MNKFGLIQMSRLFFFYLTIYLFCHANFFSLNKKIPNIIMKHMGTPKNKTKNTKKFLV